MAATLVLFDGCTRYSAAYDVGRAYTVVGTITGATTGITLKPYASFYNRAVWSGFDTILAGFRIKLPNGGSPANRTQMAILRVLSGTTVLGRLDVGSDSILRWYSHATSVAPAYLIGTASTALRRNITEEIQVQVKLATTAVGFVQIRQNGLETLSVADTITATAVSGDGLAFSYTEGNGLGVSGPGIELQGLFVYTDNAAMTFRNTSWKIERLVPIANGSRTEWTPNLVTYANWECVDDAGFSADNDYVSANVLLTGAMDLYDVTTCSPNSTIAAVRVTGLATEESTARGYKLTAHIGGSDYQSTEFTGFTDYAYRQDVHQWTVNPATSAAWLAAGINGAEFGVELTT